MCVYIYINCVMYIDGCSPWLISWSLYWAIEWSLSMSICYCSRLGYVILHGLKGGPWFMHSSIYKVKAFPLSRARIAVHTLGCRRPFVRVVALLTSLLWPPGKLGATLRMSCHKKSGPKNLDLRSAGKIMLALCCTSVRNMSLKLSVARNIYELVGSHDPTKILRFPAFVSLHGPPCSSQPKGVAAAARRRSCTGGQGEWSKEANSVPNGASRFAPPCPASKSR